MQPDVVIPADKALDMAHCLALKKLQSKVDSVYRDDDETNAKLRDLRKEFPGE